MLPAVVALMHQLRLLQAVADIGEEGGTFLQVASYSSHPGFSRLVRAEGGWVTAVDHVKRCLLERGLVSRVVHVLGPGEPPQPLARSITYETPEVYDNDAVRGFRLAVGLGVEGGRHMQLGAHKPHQLAPKHRCEHRVAV